MKLEVQLYATTIHAQVATACLPNVTKYMFTWLKGIAKHMDTTISIMPPKKQRTTKWQYNLACQITPQNIVLWKAFRFVFIQTKVGKSLKIFAAIAASGCIILRFVSRLLPTASTCAAPESLTIISLTSHIFLRLQFPHQDSRILDRGSDTLPEIWNLS